MLVGAHDLILHILEPSLQQRATLRDIAMHRWLQDQPQQDLDSLYVISRPDTDADDSLSSDSTKLSGDSTKGNLDDGLRESESNCCSENCRTRLPITGASSFYDSISVQNSDVQSRSSSGNYSYSPNSVPVSVEVSSQPARDKVVTGDYIPLCDDGASGHRLQLSAGITSKEYSSEDCRKTAGGSFEDQLISTTHNPSHVCTSCDRYSTNCDPLSDADHVTVSGVVDERALAAAAETRLPVSFSADSLELLTDGNCDSDSADTSNGENSESKQKCADDSGVTDVKNLDDDDDDEDSDNGDAANSRCGNYDFADIDAVLDHVTSSVGCTTADADASSQVSYDSLEDAV